MVQFQVSLVELSVVPPAPIGVPLYDKDKLAWELEPDTLGDTLRLRLVHRDAKNIPRNHIRYYIFKGSKYGELHFLLRRYTVLPDFIYFPPSLLLCCPLPSLKLT